jgi:hypothetical protein
MSPELDAKRVELIKDILPQLSRLTVLYNPTYHGSKLHAESISVAAATLNVAIRFVEVRSICDFDAAFAAILKRCQALIACAADCIGFTQNLYSLRLDRLGVKAYQFSNGRSWREADIRWQCRVFEDSGAACQPR